MTTPLWTCSGHQFRLDAPEDLDAALRDLVAEAYRVGLREHLRS